MSTSFPQLTPWRSPTAPPPQMVRIDPATLTMMREQMINVHALAELTGIPTLYRWGRAIWERRPIHEIEHEYFQHIFRQLQQLGATAPTRLEVPQRGIIPADYIAEGRRASPTVHVPRQVSHIIATDMPEDLKKRLQAVGVPTSPEDVAAAVAGRSMVLAPTVLPGMAGITRETAKQLAKVAAAGFGVGGTGAAAVRTVQGFPEEAPKAFLEVGLASTVAADAAAVLRALAAGASAHQLRAAAQQVLRRRQEMRGLEWRDPEGEVFVKEVEDALLRLKKGDTSKYDALVRQFEDWQKKVEEFQKLYELKQRGELPPDKESEYTKLLREVLRIRDRYDDLKMYIEAAREMGLEAGARRMEFEKRTIEDLARAVQETPPGPPPRDVMEWLQKVDIDFLQRLTRDQKLLSRHARRFGVDEQTLAERAALALRERQWERLSELPSEELKKMLMDETLLRKRASELGVGEDKLRSFIEDVLQRRMGIKPPEAPPKAEPQPKPPIEPAPERPPIEWVRPKTEPRVEDQFRSPDVEGVVTREGQVLIVRPKEEVRVARLEELPDVQTRLRVLLRRRLRAEEGPRASDAVAPQVRVRAPDEQVARMRDAETPRARDEQTTRVSNEQAPRDAETGRVKEAEGQTTAVRTEETVKTADAPAERVVLDRDALRAIIPALPAYVFSMPATTVLAMISRAVGAPIALAPGLPKPLPREPFGKWLDRVFAGMGFTWRSLAAQREVFVFA